MLTRRVRSLRGQWSLIGTLVSVAILIALAAIYLPRLVRPAGPDAQEATAMQQANGVACGEYLSQLNQAVQSYKTDNDGQPPRSLDDLKKYGVTSEMLNSPGCAFRLDPATGGVTNGPAAASAPPAAPPAPGAPVILRPPSAPPRPRRAAVRRHARAGRHHHPHHPQRRGRPVALSKAGR